MGETGERKTRKKRDAHRGPVKIRQARALRARPGGRNEGLGYHKMVAPRVSVVNDLEVASAHLGMTVRLAFLRLFGPRPGESRQDWLARLQRLALAGHRLPLSEEPRRRTLDFQVERGVLEGIRLVATAVGVMVGAVSRLILEAIIHEEGGILPALANVNEIYAAANTPVAETA